MGVARTASTRQDDTRNVTLYCWRDLLFALGFATKTSFFHHPDDNYWLSSHWVSGPSLGGGVYKNASYQFGVLFTNNITLTQYVDEYVLTKSCQQEQKPVQRARR